jgi:hypothetical protein
LTASEADCGPNLPASFAQWHRSSLSWKTRQICLDGELEEFSGTWPTAGLMRNGVLFARPNSEPPTSVTVCSFSAISDREVPPCPCRGVYFPTPVVSNGSFNSHSDSRVRPSLRMAVQLWPGGGLTPAVRTGKRRSQVPGKLNPAWEEWVMGFPTTWTDLEPSETPSSPKSPSGSESESSPPPQEIDTVSQNPSAGKHR